MGSGKSPTNLEAMSLNDSNIVDLGCVCAIHAVDSEVKHGLKSNSVISDCSIVNLN